MNTLQEQRRLEKQLIKEPGKIKMICPETSKEICLFESELPNWGIYHLDYGHRTKSGNTVYFGMIKVLECPHCKKEHDGYVSH